MSTTRHDYKITLVTLGRWSVGKTSLARRFAQGKFDENQFATVGAMHLHKVVDSEGSQVLVEIWDTAGQEQYDAITDQYYRSAQGVLIVYDATDPDSFERAKQWVEKLRKEVMGRHNKQGLVVAVVANKVDKVDERNRLMRAGQTFALEEGFLYFETSAKTGANVDVLFESMVKAVPAPAHMGPVVSLDEFDRERSPPASSCTC
ncbi:small rabrelated GTPase [Acanthamoeba castellanii str. Neff]|uniref:Small rabrelated GTPase n=1 Tax=Acanthamoeba castellanii (strain ATCC 30010 / Neff) TaxID=1257118 RepID=L8HD72_ACACF|nr:small rabrelated GTPase [Acanthamoeba castellanii str. Neff]ELR23489.1 small rabrelated GTPase [Acanthamoeba castellanii str. Neff]